MKLGWGWHRFKSNPTLFQIHLCLYMEPSSILELQDTVTGELSRYKKAEEVFGLPKAIRARKPKSQGNYY